MKSTIIKALAYRLIIMITQFVYLYVTTGDASFSIDVVVIFGMFATIEYILMEKYWDKFMFICKKYYKRIGETI